MLAPVVIELQHRAPRVRFKHPVRVVPLDGSPRIYRTLTANLSRKGMFVRMPEPLPKGTRVALSLEAGGQALPFAEAEIAWCRTSESQLPGRFTGFGVRFTSFLNPRAPELVEYLVKNLDRGRPLKMAPTRSARHRRLVGLAAGVLALLALGGLGARSLLHWAAEDDELATPDLQVASVVVAPAAPVAPSPAVEPAAAVTAAEADVEPAAAEAAVAAAPSAPEPTPTRAAVAEPTTVALAAPGPDEAAASPGASAPGRTAAAESEPKAAPADEALAEKTASAPTRTAGSEAKAAPVAAPAMPADEAPGMKTASADLAPRAPAPAKVIPAESAPTPKTAPAPKIAAAKSRPGAQGRLALPSGAAQTLSWEERGDAIHVGLALAPGATVGRRFLLAGPPRLVMDLDGRAPKKSLTLEAKAPWLKQVRIGPHGASTRVVVDLASAPAAMTQGDDGVTLTFAR